MLRSARSTSLLLLAIVALLALPATALAGTDDQSGMDSAYDDIATDGALDDSSSGVLDELSDSPTAKTYGGDPEDPLPPPVDCEDTVDGCDDPCDVDGGGAGGDDVCGGGGDDPLPEFPTVDGGGETPVAGDGAIPLAATPVTAVGGGDDLPFTGGPVGLAVGLALILLAIGTLAWWRGRPGHGEA